MIRIRQIWCPTLRQMKAVSSVLLLYFLAAGSQGQNFKPRTCDLLYGSRECDANLLRRRDCTVYDRNNEGGVCGYVTHQGAACPHAHHACDIEKRADRQPPRGQSRASQLRQYADEVTTQVQQYILQLQQDIRTLRQLKQDNPQQYTNGLSRFIEQTEGYAKSLEGRADSLWKLDHSLADQLQGYANQVRKTIEHLKELRPNPKPNPSQPGQQGLPTPRAGKAS